jgi:hypothetical protein
MKVRTKVSFAGSIGGVDSPKTGTVIEVDDVVGKALCEDGRAVAVERPKQARVERRKGK